MKSQTLKIVTTFEEEIRFPVSTRAEEPRESQTGQHGTIAVLHARFFSRQYPADVWRIQYSALND